MFFTLLVSVCMFGNKFWIGFPMTESSDIPKILSASESIQKIFECSSLETRIWKIKFLKSLDFYTDIIIVRYVGLFLSYSLNIHTLASILSTGSKIASFFSCSSVLRSFNHRDMGLIPFNLVWTSTWKIKITWNLMKSIKSYIDYEYILHNPTNHNDCVMEDVI